MDGSGKLWFRRRQTAGVHIGRPEILAPLIFSLYRVTLANSSTKKTRAMIDYSINFRQKACNFYATRDTVEVLIRLHNFKGQRVLVCEILNFVKTKWPQIAHDINLFFFYLCVFVL